MGEKAPTIETIRIKEISEQVFEKISCQSCGAEALLRREGTTGVDWKLREEGDQGEDWDRAITVSTSIVFSSSEIDREGSGTVVVEEVFLCPRCLRELLGEWELEIFKREKIY